MKACGAYTDQQRRDSRVAQAWYQIVVQAIYDEFDRKQNEHLSRHHAVTDNFAINTIYGLVTSIKHKNIPDLKPSTNYDHIVALKTSCDAYVDMTINSCTADIAKILAEL